jgi:hypothetical protein
VALKEMQKLVVLAVVVDIQEAHLPADLEIHHLHLHRKVMLVVIIQDRLHIQQEVVVELVRLGLLVLVAHQEKVVTELQQPFLEHLLPMQVVAAVAVELAHL